MDNHVNKKIHILDHSIFYVINLSSEKIILLLIIFISIFSRFYQLGMRVMSHDEINHVYFAWQFYKGSPYIHHPLSHGPFQFHILYLSYFLFGASDFSARLPAAIFSIGAVLFVWKYKRYFGKLGGLIAALFFTISPFLLYYGRYARNEAFVVLFGVITIWCILRYLESGESRFLYCLSVVLALHFSTKETAFIYTAQALLFLALLFLFRIAKVLWLKPLNTKWFYILLIISFISLATALITSKISLIDGTPQTHLMMIFISLSLLFGSASLFLLIQGFGWKRLCQEHSFELLIMIGTIVLPHLAAFPMKWLGYDPMAYQSSEGILQMLLFLIPLFIISSGIGLLWQPRLWLVNIGIFYSVFIPLFTSFFTNGAGVFSGLMGSLGYWLEQQAVERGSQPWFYYLFLQIPFYEYLAFFGLITAVLFGFFYLFKLSRNHNQLGSHELTSPNPGPSLFSNSLVFFLLLYWSISSFVAYSIAGEKMPWLSVHIAWPMLLLTSWIISNIIESIDWSIFNKNNGALLLIFYIVFTISLCIIVYSSSSYADLFLGHDIISMRNTGNFLLLIGLLFFSSISLLVIIPQWDDRQLRSTILLTIFSALTLLTIRTSIISSYINHDMATEYLVYAHSGPGPKDAFQQIEDISQRSTGGRDLKVAFDNHTAYPFWWYLRDYKQQFFFGEDASRTLLDYPVILVGDANYSKIEPLIGQAYTSFEYIRMWWPNQDYFDLSFVYRYLKDPSTRLSMINALIDIWMDRDYSRYSEVIQRDMSNQNWSPSNKMRMYVRKDILSQLWQYGIPAVDEQSLILDPYNENYIEILPDMTIPLSVETDLIFLSPHDLDFAPDGTIYVADTDNNRVIHLDNKGQLISTWGGYGVLDTNDDSPGLFNQPWGIAVDDHSDLYVADTWNHRIQKFNSDGAYINSWGVYGQNEGEYSLWGPRDIEIDDLGNVLITDTGNKRVVIFDQNGTYIDELSLIKNSAVQLNEPVGLAFDPNTSRLYVADTWNQKIQVFERQNQDYINVFEWQFLGWYGQSLENKPFLAVNSQGDLFVADPEAGRIIVFDVEGNYQYSLGNNAMIKLVGGLAFDDSDNLWVTDAQLNRLYKFILSID